MEEGSVPIVGDLTVRDGELYIGDGVTPGGVIVQTLSDFNLTRALDPLRFESGPELDNLPNTSSDNWEDLI